MKNQYTPLKVSRKEKLSSLALRETEGPFSLVQKSNKNRYSLKSKKTTNISMKVE